jgi:hypothetical protein
MYESNETRAKGMAADSNSNTAANLQPPAHEAPPAPARVGAMGRLIGTRFVRSPNIVLHAFFYRYA